MTPGKSAFVRDAMSSGEHCTSADRRWLRLSASDRAKWESWAAQTAETVRAVPVRAAAVRSRSA